jgi:bacterioferritin-associated ferredoxin
MYVCLCHGVTDTTIRKVADEGVTTVEELGERTSLGTSCGCCRDIAEIILSQSITSSALPDMACAG